jgi:hypothetical protein
MGDGSRNLVTLDETQYGRWEQPSYDTRRDTEWEEIKPRDFETHQWI